jgi:hypothetical protein
MANHQDYAVKCLKCAYEGHFSNMRHDCISTGSVPVPALPPRASAHASLTPITVTTVELPSVNTMITALPNLSEEDLAKLKKAIVIAEKVRAMLLLVNELQPLTIGVSAFDINMKKECCEMIVRALRK